MLCPSEPTFILQVKIDLVEVPVDELFAICSLSEYDLANMGRGIYACRKVGATQTADDAKDEESQTIEVGKVTFFQKFLSKHCV
jgi:hypothetical protein